MSDPGIFLIGDRNELVELQSSSYGSEAMLQELLERHPNLLVGDQVDPESPRRWLLIDREAGVPDQLGGTDRWSLDHLFLDQDGIPTLVEVKRSSDSRIRREVVGQMLDYAANSIAYWPADRLRVLFEARSARNGRGAEDLLTEFLNPGVDPDSFWESVQLNLQAGKVRLVFVADEIPAELRRVIEFLSTQMSPAQVLGIEIKHYAGGSFRGLVPRVVGQTEHARQKRRAASGATPREQWDVSSFLDALQARRGEDEAATAQRIIKWAEDNGGTVWGGLGTSSGSLFYNFGSDTAKLYPFSLWTYGKIEVLFQNLMRVPAFEDAAKRGELQRRLNRIEGVDIQDASLSRRPSIPFALLKPETALEQFFDAMRWTIDLGRTIA